MFCRNFFYPEYNNNVGTIINIVLSVITMSISIPGNMITAVVILRTDALRSEATYLLICSMCVADILVSLLAQPLLITSMVLGTRASCYVDNVFFTFSWGMAMSSALGIITITVDRFIYINYPLRYRSIVTKGKAKVLILVVWIISTLFASVPLFWYHQLTLQSVTLAVLLSISAALVYTYSQISRKIHSAIIITPATVANPVQKHKSQRQATRTVLFIVLSFFVCWYPWVIVSFIFATQAKHSLDGSVTNYYSSDSYMVALYWLFLVFGHSNSAFNVFIYSQKDKVLRSKISRFIGLASSSTNYPGVTENLNVPVASDVGIRNSWSPFARKKIGSKT